MTENVRFSVIASQGHSVTDFRCNTPMRFKTIGQRVRYALAQSKRSADEVASKAGLARSTLYDLMNDRQKNTTKLPGIADAVGFRVQWLENESGPERDHGASGVSDNVRNTYFSPRLFPVIDWIQAGEWGENADPYEPGDAEDWFAAPPNAKVSECSFWLEVEGRSMVSQTGGQSFPPGTYILVDPLKKDCQTGDLVVARRSDTGETTFKRLNIEAGAIFLEPLNNQYSAIEITGASEIIGKVVSYMGSL